MVLSQWSPLVLFMCANKKFESDLWSSYLEKDGKLRTTAPPPHPQTQQGSESWYFSPVILLGVNLKESIQPMQKTVWRQKMDMCIQTFFK
jgi:hypothetical protein